MSHNIEQLRGSLAGLSAEQIDKVVIAYEPVWAIGTGRVASSADAQEVCAAIRKELGALASPQIAQSVRVLYGGSMNAKNVGDLVAQEDIDGGLVGGASLDGEQFATLAAIAAGDRCRKRAESPWGGSRPTSDCDKQQQQGKDEHQGQQYNHQRHGDADTVVALRWRTERTGAEPQTGALYSSSTQCPG